LAPWLKKERNRSALVNDWVAALHSLHQQFDWEYPCTYILSPPFLADIKLVLFTDDFTKTKERLSTGFQQRRRSSAALFSPQISQTSIEPPKLTINTEKISVHPGPLSAPPFLTGISPLAISPTPLSLDDTDVKKSNCIELSKTLNKKHEIEELRYLSNYLYNFST
jgi:hypothetical protein